VQEPAPYRPIDKGLARPGLNSCAMGAGLVVTLGATPLAGNTLVVAVALNSGFVTSISGGGVTWTAAVIRSPGSHVPTEIWSGIVTGTPATAITITVPVGAVVAKVMEWSGGGATDLTASATATSCSTGSA